MTFLKVRGIRGAISVPENTAESIWSAAEELLSAMIRYNEVAIDDIASILFSTTKDLNAAFPARAARNLGWHQVPLLDVQQLEAPDLPRLLRILMHVNTAKKQHEVQHVYLGEAQLLRPDLSPARSRRG